MKTKLVYLCRILLTSAFVIMENVNDIYTSINILYADNKNDISQCVDWSKRMELSFKKYKCCIWSAKLCRNAKFD